MSDEWADREQTVTDEQLRVRLLRERCTTCILGGQDSITPYLRPGRLKQLITDAADNYVVCHSTLGTPRPAVCRGWFEEFGSQSNYIRVMSRLSGMVEVDPHDEAGRGA